MQKINPFLWFDGNLEDAITFYKKTFRKMKVTSVNRLEKKGPVFSATFDIEGQQFFAINERRTFQFTEAISFMIYCKTQGEIDRLWEQLSSGGKKSRCGWLKDKFGLWWQVVPANLNEFVYGKDEAGRKRAMAALMKMDKFDMKMLKDAYNQK